jgi:hypothetical protein
MLIFTVKIANQQVTVMARPQIAWAGWSFVPRSVVRQEGSRQPASLPNREPGDRAEIRPQYPAHTSEDDGAAALHVFAVRCFIPALACRCAVTISARGSPVVLSIDKFQLQPADWRFEYPNSR